MECNCLAVLQILLFWPWRNSRLYDKVKTIEAGVPLKSYQNK